MRARGGEIWDKADSSCCCHVSLALEPSPEVGYHIGSGAGGWLAKGIGGCLLDQVLAAVVMVNPSRANELGEEAKTA